MSDTSRLILVTGSTRRLGAGLARALVAAGYPVVLHARAASDEAHAIADELGAPLLLGDLGDPDVPARLIAEAGPLTGLINNASRFEFDTISSTTAAALSAHFAPNVIAPVLLAQAFAAQTFADQAPQAGVIINMLDQKLTNLNPDFFAYTLSKAALSVATEMMAQSLAPRIRVCGIAPGLTLPSTLQSPERFAAAWRATRRHGGRYRRRRLVHSAHAIGHRHGHHRRWRRASDPAAARYFLQAPGLTI
jgi:NAD(P)-dependent dehydrogenase (short-subunit alcohol dehydrogenase family)